MTQQKDKKTRKKVKNVQTTGDFRNSKREAKLGIAETLSPTWPNMTILCKWKKKKFKILQLGSKVQSKVQLNPNTYLPFWWN